MFAFYYVCSYVHFTSYVCLYFCSYVGYIANSIIRKRMGIHQRGVEKLKSSEGLTFDVRAFIVDRPSAYRSPSLDTYTFSDYSISGDNDNLGTNALIKVLIDNLYRV